MSFNLVRNSRLWFSTNVDAATGVLGTNSTSSSNTWEILVLDGFSFSQTTQQTTIQISEAGSAPVRGQRAFNTALDPVEVTFSTYIRPKLESSEIIAEERFLWNAIFGDQAIDAGTAIAGGSPTGVYTAGTGTLVISGTALTSFASLVGTVVTVQGVVATTGANSQAFNTPATVTAATTSSITLTYLNAPPADTVTLSASTTKLAKSAWTAHTAAANGTAFAQITTGTSNKNQLQKFALIFKVDNAIYAVDNCAVDQASIDFALDGIATVAWTVRGTKLRYLDAATITDADAAVFGGTGLGAGTAAAPISTPNYITNKLSTMSLKANIGGGGTSYNVALTGGNITIANNINYITPANLGVVNESIGYFTGARAISGNVTAYLRTGTNNSAQLLKDIVTANEAETKFYLKLDVGGSSNPIRVEMVMPGVVLQIPTVETADVISTTINFTAQGHENVLSGTNGADTDYDIAAVNDLRIRYYSA